jgi:hypothetical protein
MTGLGNSVATSRLLVSVRDVDEANAAMTGGCDILDVKEPSQGSLGMADVRVIDAIVRSVASTETGSNHIPVSAALGETVDWLDENSVPVLPAGLSYVKLGTAGLADRDENGLHDWSEIRGRFEQVSLAPLQWVAVSYVDWERAHAPRPDEIVAEAIRTSCAGVLFDTFLKDGRALLDWISINELTELIAAARKAGLFAAVAGSLSISHFPLLADCHADIVAVRTAACKQGKRVNRISVRATQALSRALRENAHP